MITVYDDGTSTRSICFYENEVSNPMTTAGITDRPLRKFPIL